MTRPFQIDEIVRLNWWRKRATSLIGSLVLLLCAIAVFPARGAGSDSGANVARLLTVARTEPNWPYIWLAHLESIGPSQKSLPDSSCWEGQRLFLKGIAYFYIVPEYSRRRDLNRRLQILEKVLDNWKAAATDFSRLKTTGARTETRRIAAARKKVFERYLVEKQTRRYHGQSLTQVFQSVLSQPCSEGKTSFVAAVVCALTRENPLQTK